MNKTFAVTIEGRLGKFWLVIYMNKRQITKFDISGKNHKERTDIQCMMGRTLFLINN